MTEKSKRILLVSDSYIWEVDVANIAHRILEKCGWEVLRLEWNHRHYIPSSPARAMTGRHLALFDESAFASAPRLSTKEYHEICGDDLDFNKLNMKDDWIDGFRIDEAHLNPESPQMQRLRGAAWRFENLLLAVRPDAVMIRQGCDPFSLVNLAKAIKLGLPAFAIESGFLPGHVYFELRGQHYYPDFRRLDAIYKSGRPIVAAGPAMELLQKIRKNISGLGISKYEQVSDQCEIEALEDFKDRFTGKILFFPEQMPFDSNVFSSLREIGLDSIYGIYQKVVAALPEDVGIVFKRHPKIISKSPLVELAAGRNILFLERLSIADIFKRVAAVVTLTSNVGLEAAVCGLPVLSLGSAIYAGKGFTLDWDGQATIAPYLHDIFDFNPDEEKVATFLYTLKKEALFSPEDPPEDFEGLCRGDEFTPKPDVRAPFWKEGKGNFASYHQAKEEYAVLSRQNFIYQEIMTKLDKPILNSTNPHQLGVDKQTNQELAARYAFAQLFLPPEGRILDAGAGSGYGANFLAVKTKAQVMAFDASEEAIEYAGRFFSASNIKFMTLSAGAFECGESPDLKAQFDLVTVFEFLACLPSPEIFIVCAKKSLALGGVLVGSVPHRDVFPLQEQTCHVRHYDLPALEILLDIKSGEGVRYFYQNGASISNDHVSGRSIIFVISCDLEKLRLIENHIPFQGPEIEAAIDMNQQLTDTEAAIDINQQLTDTEVELRRLEECLRLVYDSSSWRLTRPLRGCVLILRRYFGSFTCFKNESKQFLKSWLIRLISFIRSRSLLNNMAIFCLHRMPRFKERLRCLNAGQASTIRTFLPESSLSPREKLFYLKLKAACERERKNRRE